MKFFISLFSILYAGVAFANCTAVKSWDFNTVNMTPKDDELLYPNKATYDKMVSSAKNFSGWFYQCGRQCDTGSYVYMGAGHVHNGDAKYYDVLYNCSLGFGYSFSAVGLADCYSAWGEKGKAPSYWSKQTVYNANSRGTFYKNNYMGTVCVLEPEIANCEADSNPNGHWNNGTCQCGNGTTWDSKKQKCVPLSNSTTCTNNETRDKTCSQDYINKNAASCLEQCVNGKWKTAIKTCKSGYQCIQYNDGIGCKECKAQNTSTPAPKAPKQPKQPRQPSTPAEKSCAEKNKCSTNPNPAECATCCMVASSVATWDAAANKCKCADTAKVFDVASASCITPAPEFKCDAEKLKQLAQWRVQYASDSAIVAKIDEILALCNASTTVQADSVASDATPDSKEVTFNIKWEELQDLMRKNAKDAENQEKLKSDQEKSRKTIGEIKDKINQLKAGLGTSVWKNKEGNFNTARLASDSIAGVVLGTAGGLITSNIIKKNQIKGGFEDISCTIGGQTVAGYGDQFQVGIQ